MGAHWIASGNGRSACVGQSGAYLGEPAHIPVPALRTIAHPLDLPPNLLWLDPPRL